MASISQTLRSAQSVGLDRLDAQLLILHALGKPDHDRSWLQAHDTEELSPATLSILQACVKRRASGEPLAYITEHKEFFGLDLMVDRRVLVPRPDTELLVEWTLEVLARIPNPSVIDLGTGSGAIALALKSTRNDLQITATDISLDALNVAHVNAQRQQLEVNLLHGSWLDGIPGRYHAIISNPPYIADGDQHLGALRHEPQQALTSGHDGLKDIRDIVAQASLCLHPDGWLLVEHGHDQAEAVRRLLTDACFLEVQSRRDLSGIERCSGARLPPIGI